jgi:hypothetical protein
MRIPYPWDNATIAQERTKVFGRSQFGERIRYRKRAHCEMKPLDAQRGRKSGFANALRMFNRL